MHSKTKQHTQHANTLKEAKIKRQILTKNKTKQNKAKKSNIK